MCLVRSLGASLGPSVASGGDNTWPRPVPSPVGLWAVSAVIALMMAAESTPPTPIPVAEAFVTAVVEFGLGLTAIWRLP